MRVDMQAKTFCSSGVEYCSSRRVAYDEKSSLSDMLRIDSEIKGEMDFVGKPSATDKLTPVVNIIKDKVDLHNISELESDIRNMSMPDVGTSTCGKDSIDNKSVGPFNLKHGHEVISFNGPTPKCSSRTKHQLSIEEMKSSNGSVDTVSGLGISSYLPEDGKYQSLDIGVDEGVPSEDKVIISSDCNIRLEKLSGVKPSVTDESSRCSSGLENKECESEDQSSSAHDWNRLTDGGLPCSQPKNRKEDEKFMLDEACILKALNTDGESVLVSSKENEEVKRHGTGQSFDEYSSSNAFFEKKENILEYLTKDGDRYDEERFNLDISDLADDSNGKLETSTVRQSAVLGSFVRKVMIVPDDNSTSMKNIENDVKSSACGDGSHDNVKCAGESFETEGKMMKIRGYLSQENAELYLPNKSQWRTNPFIVSEKEAQFMQESYSASLGSHSVSSACERFETEGKTMKDSGCLSQINAELYFSNEFQLTVNPFAVSEDEAQFMAELNSASLGSHSTSSAHERFEAERKMMKDRCCLSQGKSEIFLSNNLRTNPFAVSEKEEAQFMPESYSASLGRYSASSASEGFEVGEKMIKDRGSLSQENTEICLSNKLRRNPFASSEETALKVSDNFQSIPVTGHQTVSEKLKATEVDPKKLVEELSSDKHCNSTDSVTSEKSAMISISTVTVVDSETTKDVENQRQKTIGSSANPVGYVCPLEMRSNVPIQNINQVMYDVSDKLNGLNSVAEIVYTHSGPIPLSGPISYSGPLPLSGRVSYSSGPIPNSGSISVRSDSSTASTHSFAFPVLPNEWNSSPVKMQQADSRYFKKKHRCRFCCFCCIG